MEKRFTSTLSVLLMATPLACSDGPATPSDASLTGVSSDSPTASVPSPVDGASGGSGSTPTNPPTSTTSQPPVATEPARPEPVMPPPVNTDAIGGNAGTGGSSPSGNDGGMSGTGTSGGEAGAMGLAGETGGGAGGRPDMGMAGASGMAGDMGVAGEAGMNGDPDEPNPSPGCGQSGRPDGGSIYVSNESWLVFPESYDGNTPLPVLFGFHGCGSGNRGDATRTEYTDAIRNTVFQTEYVVAVPISSDAGGCWNYNNDIGRVRDLYDDLVANHCVDMNRVFATGHSSGAYFAVAVLEAGHTEDAEHLNFRGMAPVAASPVNNHSTPMAVFYMENPNDTERGDDNAQRVVEGYLSANMCGDATQPYEGIESCNSSSGGASVNPGCVIYDGCTHPTVWCSHDDQSYGTTGHGIPCFAAQGMDAFFKSL